MKQWFSQNPTLRLDNTAPPRARVLCFHGAGCDSSLFTTRGTPSKPLANPLLDFCMENDIELLSFQMPGRGNRMNDKPCSDIMDVAESCLNALEPYLARSTPSQSVVGPVPLFIVGHSMGALVAYEFACLMRKRQLPPPKQLVFACMAAPNLPLEDRPWRPVANLSDAEFQQELRGWGVNDEVFKSGVWQVFEPILRNDLLMVDNYHFTEPLGGNSVGGVSSPIRSSGSPTTASSQNGDSPQRKQGFHAPLGLDTLCVYGTQDPRVSRDLVQGWERVIMGTNLFSSSPSGFGTAANNGSEFGMLEVEGNHNFLYESLPRKQFFDSITERLDQMLIEAEYGNC